MPNSQSRSPEPIKSALFLLVLISIVAYFALSSIPSAQRPTLQQRSTVPATSPVPHVETP